MEELLKLVELVRQEAPKARVKVDNLMVKHYFTMEELLNICNKYTEYKCALVDVVWRSEQLVNFLLHLNNKELINNQDFDYEKEAKKYLKKTK